ncbi:MAG: peptidoglycan-binding protein [Candidatus Adlerbacteria bacterium]|nr:peptidoglycan-binding protein [Candidatus Adlerbacteria bacterium]
MTISITKSSRIVALAVGASLVLAVAFGSFAAPAQALTQSEATTIIQILGLTGSQAAAIQALVSGGSSTTSLCTFTGPLTIGATGAQVTCLQENLISMGFSIPAGATRYFGTQTRAAVAAWQASKNIVPPVGYFGPISQGAWATMVPGTPGTPGTPSTPSGLSGGAGSISDVDYITSLNNEEVGEGANDVEVAGLNIEADDGSDIELTAVNLNFSPGAGVGTNDLDEYIDEVTIWVEGKKVATVDASDFEDDQNFDRTISLSSGGIIRAGDTGDLVVAVSALSSIDSADAGDTWNLEFESVRFRDAQGASITDSATGDINDATGRNFTVDTFATANNVELKAQSSDDTPEGVVNVDDTNDTDGVVLARFTLEAEGGDIRVRDFPITFATSTGGTANGLDDIASTVYLSVDGVEYSEQASAAVYGVAGATVTFDDVDVTIDEGDKVNVIVSADINDTQAGSFLDGDALTASFSASNRNIIDADDESGEALAAGDKTGTATGEAIAFFDVGIIATFVSATETLTPGADGTADDDTVTMKLVFDVEAFDGTVYVSNLGTSTDLGDGDVTAIDVDDGGIVYRYEIDGTATTALLAHVVSKSDTSGTVADDGVDEYTFEDGEKARLTLTITRSNAATHTLSDGFHDMQLVAIGFSTTIDDDTMSVYEFDLDDFKTDPIFAN